jgi:hypothetical protein
MPKSVTASLEALLKAEVSQRIAEVKTVTDSVIEQIRMAAGRTIAELEHLADQIAAGEVEVDATPAVPVQGSAEPAQTTAVPSQATPAATPAPVKDAQGFDVVRTSIGNVRSGWIAGTSGRLPY